jgi:hypothetical protein
VEFVLKRDARRVCIAMLRAVRRVRNVNSMGKGMAERVDTQWKRICVCEYVPRYISFPLAAVTLL